MIAIQASDLVVRLGARAVLERVDASFARGTVTALVGPNGAGKTTFLRTLAGLTRASAGSVEIEGSNVATMTAQARALRLAWVPTPEPPPFPYTVLETVKLGRFARHEGRPRAADEEAALRSLAAVGLPTFASRLVTELSGGELARVAVARGLAAETDLVLLDEPTASLDVAAALRLLILLRQLAAAGRTIVLSLHDLSVAYRYADHVVMLGAGRVVAAGPPRDALTPASLRAAFGVSAQIARTADGREALFFDPE